MRTYVLLIAGWILACCSGPSAADENYLLQPGDVLVVAVWKEPELSQELLVRPDGGISMPLAGDVAAAGHTTDEVRATINERLRPIIADPAVTVAVKVASGNQVFIVGKVNRPGQYPMNRPLDVMQVLSLAGGATSFASLNDIRVLRREGNRQLSIPFHYGQVASGRHLDQNIVLKGGDTVVVP